MFTLLNKPGTAKKAVLTILSIMLTIFTASAEEKFSMDENQNQAFSPVYSYLILGAVFILAIIVYIVFKPKDKSYSPTSAAAARGNARTAAARDPRRRPSTHKPL